ncbi:hypothetical protein HYT26_03660 [Candidatus Pacearchaeota archaeon]|nr:hypothetical protein [Candidatus Pacearchaeota archaeon]
MQYKDIRQIVNCSITGGLATTFLLTAPLENAFAKGKKVDYDFTTNTIKYMQEKPTSQKEHPFFVQELQVGDERYAVIAIPKDKDIKIKGAIINPNIAKDFYLVPFSKSSDIIDPSARSVEVEGKNYVPVNIGMAGNKLCIAKTLEERTMNTDIKINRQDIGKGFRITTRENKNMLYGIDGVSLTGERLLVIANDQDIYNSDAPGDYETIDRLDFLFTSYNGSKIIINRETGNIQVKAAPFVPLEATFVDKEPVKEKEEPKAIIE